MLVVATAALALDLAEKLCVACESEISLGDCMNAQFLSGGTTGNQKSATVFLMCPVLSRSDI